MKKSVVIASLASFAILSAAPIMAIAAPVGVDILVSCPKVTTLSYSKDSISGTGLEVVAHQSTTTPYFQLTSHLADNMPSDLSGYTNGGTKYDSRSGTVSCTYIGGSTYLPSFSLSTVLTHGDGATVVQTTDNSIELSLPVGVKA